MSAREEHAVELVSPSGSPIGSTTVDVAHREPGRLHRAFSVFLRDTANGHVLVQQRAAVKTRFPLRWANSCCGHPLPGEDVTVAARRRLVEELGVPGVSLTEVGVYVYRASDPSTGRVEHEYDHVLLGDLPAGSAPVPDPAEVADLRWVPVESLSSFAGPEPDRYAPWLAGVSARLATHLAGDPAAPAPPVPAPAAPHPSASVSSSTEWPGGR